MFLMQENDKYYNITQKFPVCCRKKQKIKNKWVMVKLNMPHSLLPHNATQSILVVW